MSLSHIPTSDRNDSPSDEMCNPSPSTPEPSDSKQPKHLHSVNNQLPNLSMKASFAKVKKYGGLKYKWSEVESRKGESTSQVGTKTDEVSPDDIIIALIGPTGSGKSSFINTIAGSEIDSLESSTSEMIIVRLPVPEMVYGDLVFVNTPGFDDTNKYDGDVLIMIAEWLKSTYGRKTLLSGLLYFHQMTDHRIAGTPLKNLRLFEELCGKGAFQNVVLVTTMWDRIGEEGEARERELISKYWRGMLEHGSTISRFLWTRESAFSLIDPLIDRANKRILVLLQQEMVDFSRQLPDTSVALELYLRLEVLVRQRQELLDKIRNEIRRAGDDKNGLETLQREHEKLQKDMEETLNNMQEMKLPLGKRVVKMTQKFLGITFTVTFFKSMLAKQNKGVSSPDDIIIAVIGPTGSGKSSFINTITGRETGVGHNLESCTNEVRDFRKSLPELAYGDLVFVDTPGLGFDAENKSHVDVLKMVADWLKTTYSGDKLLSGVLYFHRITDNRIDRIPGPLKNLREFEKLCGKNSFHNVILATTMWNEITEEEGEAQEEELKSNYWRPMLERGSTTSRFLLTRESAFTLIDPLIDRANKRSLALLQQELVDISRQLPHTSGALELYSQMEVLVRQRQELLDKIRNGIRHAGDDKNDLETLKMEHEKLQKDMEETLNNMQEMKLPLGKRVVKMTQKYFGITFTVTLFKSMLAKQNKGVSSPDDIIIAVIGPTGSGKSSFINTITGYEIEVGHNLESCTHEVRGFRSSLPWLAYGDLVFVDTPGLGFDAENKSHVDVLKMVADWLKTTYSGDKLLSGVLYFHRITDNRIDRIPGPLKNLREFEKLCGKNFFHNVILATTMWNEITEEEGEAQEEELKSNYWRPMLERGSTTNRFLLTRESALTLVGPFIKAANKRISVLLQQEIVDMGRHLPAASAGQELYMKMAHLVRQRQELLDNILNEMTRRADGDKISKLEPLRKEHEMLQSNLGETINKMRELRPLGKRLIKMTTKFFLLPPS